MSMMEGSRSEVLEVTFYQQGALLKRRVFAPQGGQERGRVIALSGALVEPSVRVVGQQSGSTAMLLSVELVRSQEVYREQAPPGWRLGPEQDQGEESALTNEQRAALLDSLRVRRERLLKIRPQRLGREGGVSQSLSAGRFIESALDALDQRQALLESEIQHRGVHDEGTEQIVQRSELILSFSPGDRIPDFIDIEYFVTSARWWPCYTLHFEDGGRRARLELEAQLWQESGERWSKVKLRVTNAPAPAFESSLPIPLRRELRPAQSAGGDPDASAEESTGGSRGDLLSGYREAERLQRLNEPQSTGCLDEHAAPSEYAAGLSHFRLASPHQGLGFFYMRDREEQTHPHLEPTPPVVSELLHRPRPVEGALFVYEASAPLTVESSDVLQRLPLTSYQGEAKTTLTLCPAQGASAYRKGTLINPTAAPLLPGPIDLFYDGLLLRRGVLPLIMENGQLQLELGIEQRLRATRRVEEQRLRRGLIKEMDIVERSLEFSISSGLSVESELSLLEPLPWSEEVELLQSVTHADPLPEESPEQLTWALNIAPGAARTVSCRYQIRYPSRYQLQWEER